MESRCFRRFPRSPLCYLAFVLLVAVGCEGDPENDSAEPVVIAPIAGRYEVAGTTIDVRSGQEREISGTVILADDGEHYTATFHLNTVLEGATGVLPAEVIGRGAGQIDGRELRGTAETQLVISTVPGIDPAFAFIPRTTSTRIVSNSVTNIGNDGSVVIEIENQPAPGEEYSPTRTTLRGVRIGAPLVAGGRLPPVAAVPKAGD
jgi:hypothetical protein